MTTSTDLTPSPQLRTLDDYLADNIVVTLRELRKILPEKLFIVEHGYMEGTTIFSEIGTLAETREEAVNWIRNVTGSENIHHEVRDFLVRQSTRTRREERFWTRIFRPEYDHRAGPKPTKGKESITCGTYYSVVEIELRDLALHLNNR